MIYNILWVVLILADQVYILTIKRVDIDNMSMNIYMGNISAETQHLKYYMSFL